MWPYTLLTTLTWHRIWIKKVKSIWSRTPLKECLIWRMSFRVAIDLILCERVGGTTLKCYVICSSTSAILTNYLICHFRHRQTTMPSRSLYFCNRTKMGSRWVACANSHAKKTIIYWRFAKVSKVCLTSRNLNTNIIVRYCGVSYSMKNKNNSRLIKKKMRLMN